MQTAVVDQLSRRLGGRWTLRPAGGSGFAATWHALGDAADRFVESARPEAAGMRQAEADGLTALAATGTVRVPAVVDCWATDGACLLAIERLAFAPPPHDAGTRVGAADAPARQLDGVQRVIERLPRFFDHAHLPRPALIHADLCGAATGPHCPTARR